MKKSFIYLCFLVGIVCLMEMMASCKPSLPGDVLSKGQMTDILYDYHLALSMAHTKDGGDKGESLTYREAVLEKHDVTSAEFDSSMVYYMRHTELLKDVYKDLADRLGNETEALGGSSHAGADFNTLSATGDTANIWSYARSMVFSTIQPYNVFSFKMEADTAYHKGDCLMLDFDSQFIYQDGIRDGIALLAVEFTNDSVAQSIIHISGSQHYSMQIKDNENLGIKQVKGYFMLSDGGFATNETSESTLKLMFLEHIRLIRMHAKKEDKAKDSASKDSTKVDSLKPIPIDHSARPMLNQPLPSPNGKQLRPVEMKVE